MAALNQERFTLASDDTIEELQNMVQKIWTPAKVHRLFWLSVWKMWCEGKSKALEIEAHQLPEMNRLVLKKFNAEVKNKIHMLFRHFLHANFIMFILLISNQMVFLILLGINLHLWVFLKLTLHLLKGLLQFQLFEKLTHTNWFQIELETVWLPMQPTLISTCLL